MNQLLKQLMGQPVNPMVVYKLKQALRLTHDKLDLDLEENIRACLADLISVGVVHSPIDLDLGFIDPLIFNAIKLWCRSLYTDDPEKAAEWLRRYEALKASLMMAEGYGHQEGTGDE